MGAETPTHNTSPETVERVETPTRSPEAQEAAEASMRAERQLSVDNHQRVEAQHERDTVAADAFLERGLRNIDTTTTGEVFRRITGQTLSEAKQTTGNALSAHTVESIHGLGHAITHPVETAGNVWTAVRYPVESFNAVKESYAGEWDKAPNWYTKGAVLWRGAMDFVIGPKGVGALSKAATRAGRGVDEAARIGSASTEIAQVGTTLEQAGEELTQVAKQVETRGGAELERTAAKEAPQLTRAEKLAMKPRYIEAERWEELVDDYANRADDSPMSLVEIESAHHVEEYLARLGVHEEFRAQTVLSFDLTDKLFMGELPENTQVHRYYAGTSAPRGYYVTDQYIPTVKDRVDQLALPMETKQNGAVYHETFIIPAGTPVIRGKAAANFGKSGGGMQYYLDKEVLRDIGKVDFKK